MQNGQGKAQGAHRAPPSISAETYRQDACGRCPRSARQPPAAGKCAGLCAAGRLLGKPAPALSRGGRLLAPPFGEAKGGRDCLPDGATQPHHTTTEIHQDGSIPPIPPLAHHPPATCSGAHKEGFSPGDLCPVNNDKQNHLDHEYRKTHPRIRCHLRRCHLCFRSRPGHLQGLGDPFGQRPRTGEHPFERGRSAAGYPSEEQWPFPVHRATRSADAKALCRRKS